LTNADPGSFAGSRWTMIVMVRGIGRPPLEINDDRCNPYTFSPCTFSPSERNTWL